MKFVPTWRRLGPWDIRVLAALLPVLLVAWCVWLLISVATLQRSFDVESAIGLTLGALAAYLWKVHRQALSRAHATLEATAAGILAVDRDGRAMDWNHQFLELWRIPASLMSSWNKRELADYLANQLVDPDEFHRRLSSSYAEASVESDDELKFKDGRVFELRSRPQLLGRKVLGRVCTFRDITAERRVVTDLRASEERWHLALRGSNVGMWDWDAKTNQVFHSSRWKELLGFEDSEISNQNIEWETRVHPEDLARVKNKIDEHLDRQTSFYETEYRMRAKDGSYRWVLARGQAQWDQEGHATRLVGSHTDITERKIAAESLCRAKDAAEAANRSKGEFLANMSHEIRTPMTGVLGMIDLVLGSELNQTQREYLETARSSADSLLALLNDILDLAKIESGRVDLATEHYSLRECVCGAVQMFVMPAKRKGLSLDCDVSSDLPERVVGDPVRIRQVLVNLVGNAIKFTDRGSISVSVIKTADPDRGDFIHIEVQDTGIGISPENARLVFEPFQQVDGSSTRRHVGTGLGLTISDRLVKLMGGQLGLRTELDSGSTLTFTVPLVTANFPACSAPGADDVEKATAVGPLRILLAEDNIVNQKVVSVLLRRDGHQVYLANNGVEAVEAVREMEFDVVLMDVQMPVMDGFAATAVIRRAERGNARQTRIVALTAHAMKGDKERCLGAGMDAYLTKPIMLPALRQTLARLTADWVVRKLGEGVT